MLRRITWVLFNAIAMIAATGIAVWVTVTGHTLQIGGLLLAIGGVLGTVLFGFRLAEGYGPGELSIWPGPFRSLKAEPPVEAADEFREAA